MNIGIIAYLCVGYISLNRNYYTINIFGTLALFSIMRYTYNCFIRISSMAYDCFIRVSQMD